MKPKKIAKRLTLNKTTIATLSQNEQKKARGGTVGTVPNLTMSLCWCIVTELLPCATDTCAVCGKTLIGPQCTSPE